MSNKCIDILSRNSVSSAIYGLVSIACVYWVFKYLQEHETLHLLYNSAVVGGLLSGSLHALTGSDHLAALLPLIFGKRWLTGCFYGLIWGLGHGFASSAIGLASYSMKSFLLQNMKLFEMYGFVVDGAVGLTLMIIGIVGYYESLAEGQHEAKEDNVEHSVSTASITSSNVSDFDTLNNIDAESQEYSSVSTNPEGSPLNPSNNSGKIQPSYYRSIITTMTVFANGSVMGVSWDGLPSLAPAVVLEGWPLIWFLLFYALGTAACMCLAAGLVGETTCWISRVAKIDVTERLASLSSLCAIVIGGLWTISGGVKCAHHYYHVVEGESHSVFSMLSAREVHDATLINNDQFENINSNDNFHEHSYTTEMEVLLSCGSVLAVLGVIVYSTQYDLGVLPRYISSKPTVYKV